MLRCNKVSVLTICLLIGLLGSLASASCGFGKNTTILLATTTSLFDSGLLDVVVPAFEDETGYEVKIIPVGTGKALQMGSSGDVDLLLVHAPQAEEEFMTAGNGVNRRLAMYNYFIIVGPTDDPAGVETTGTATEGLEAIQASRTLFVSRGDESGTHMMELSLWRNIDAERDSEWYKQSGQGMAATLQIANQISAYTISDISTYFSLKETLNLVALTSEDPDMINPYHIIQINPNKFESINAQGAADFSEFLLSEKTQELISEFGVEELGQRIFFIDEESAGISNQVDLEEVYSWT